MILTDTHTHLYAKEFDEDRDEMITRCFENKITRIFLPNIDKASVKGMMELVTQFPDNCFPMIGIHPCSVDENWRKELNEYKELLKKEKL